MPWHWKQEKHGRPVPQGTVPMTTACPRWAAGDSNPGSRSTAAANSNCGFVPYAASVTGTGPCRPEHPLSAITKHPTSACPRRGPPLTHSADASLATGLAGPTLPTVLKLRTMACSRAARPPCHRGQRALQEDVIGQRTARTQVPSCHETVMAHPASHLGNPLESAFYEPLSKNMRIASARQGSLHQLAHPAPARLNSFKS